MDNGAKQRRNFKFVTKSGKITSDMLKKMGQRTSEILLEYVIRHREIK